jgi:hypothetical protein
LTSAIWHAVFPGVSTALLSPVSAKTIS